MAIRPSDFELIVSTGQTNRQTDGRSTTLNAAFWGGLHNDCHVNPFIWKSNGKEWKITLFFSSDVDAHRQLWSASLFDVIVIDSLNWPPQILCFLLLTSRPYCRLYWFNSLNSLRGTLHNSTDWPVTCGLSSRRKLKIPLLPAYSSQRFIGRLSFCLSAEKAWNSFSVLFQFYFTMCDGLKDCSSSI